LGPSPLGRAAAEAAIADVHIYPDDTAYRLRGKLADRNGVSDEQVLLGRGSSEILDMVARSFLHPGVNAVFSAHAFAMYPIFSQAAGAELRPVPALASDDPRMPFGHDLAAMAAAIDADTRVVFIANPNNPTGTWLTRDELKTFIEQVPEHVVVVLDEAYAEYVQEPDYPNGIPWVAKHPNLLVTRTFSKIYGLAGLRCGWAVGSVDLIAVLNRVRHPFNIPGPALAAAEAALDDEDFIARSVQVNNAGMEQLSVGFEDLELSSLPSVGNFLCTRVWRDGRAVYQALLREGVIVRPVDNYGLPEYLRITIGTEQENQRVLDALRRVLAA
jgi:histidinol-phosphate aminotransferase